MQHGLKIAHAIDFQIIARYFSIDCIFSDGKTEV